jgi:GNAT superfamily N-acetyltransferase
MDATVSIVPARPEDAAEILRVQRTAFQTEVDRYNAPDIPPMTETLESIENDIERAVVLKALAPGGCVVGSVRGLLDGGTCTVARLSVLPPWRRRGIGRRLVEALEAAFPRAARFRLFTGDRSEGNLRLYGSLGYRQVDRRPVSPTADLICMEKPGPDREPRNQQTDR